MDDEHKEHDRQAKFAIKQNIAKYGCHLALIEADNYQPAFAYTIGLYERYRHPEIICFGLSTDLMGRLLNHAKDLIQKGIILDVELLYRGFLDGYNVQFLKVDKDYYPDYLGYASWYYNYDQRFPVLQLVWPDKSENYPWSESFNPEWVRLQPLLDRNTDFKFLEKRNLAVYTTQQVLNGDPILYVYHNEDGDWQFHTSDNPNVDDAKLVALDELVKIDPTINQIFYLPYRSYAWRKFVGDDWESANDTE